MRKSFNAVHRLSPNAQQCKFVHNTPLHFHFQVFEMQVENSAVLCNTSAICASVHIEYCTKLCCNELFEAQCLAIQNYTQNSIHLHMCMCNARHFRSIVNLHFKYLTHCNSTSLHMDDMPCTLLQ